MCIFVRATACGGTARRAVGPNPCPLQVRVFVRNACAHRCRTRIAQSHTRAWRPILGPISHSYSVFWLKENRVQEIMARRQRMIGSEKRSQQVTAVHSSSQQRFRNCCERQSLPQSHSRAPEPSICFHSRVTACCDLLGTLLGCDHSLATRHMGLESSILGCVGHFLFMLS